MSLGHTPRPRSAPRGACPRRCLGTPSVRRLYEDRHIPVDSQEGPRPFSRAPIGAAIHVKEVAMRRFVISAMFVCLLGLPVSGFAEDSAYNFPSCGTVVNRNASWQFGSGLWVEYVLETSSTFDICGKWIVGVDARIVNVPNSSMWAEAPFNVTARRQIPVPRYGTYQTNGSHFSSGTIPNLFCCDGWWPSGQTTSQARVDYQQPSPADACAA